MIDSAFYALPPETTAALAYLPAGFSDVPRDPVSQAHTEDRHEEQYPTYKLDDLTITSDGIAIIDVVGLLTKNPSRYGGSSCREVRWMVRYAQKDPEIEAVLIRFDSPGGETRGVFDLASDVAALARTKRTVGLVEDLCCGTAYWAASQCPQIVVGTTGQVGSIGLMRAVIDSSKLAKSKGIKVHRIAGGNAPFKGAGLPGTEVTKEQRAEFQRQVDSIAKHFFDAVKAGRKLSRSQLQRVTTGGCWIGAKGVQMKLADEVGSFDSAMESIRTTTKKRS